MTDMFEERNISYGLRDSSILTQPIFNKISYGLSTFSYEAHICNMFSNDLKKCTSINSFKELIKKCPKCQCSMYDVLS